MKIYSLNTTDFSNNGYGFLTDVISAEVKEELNGEYTLTMEYLLNGHLSEYLQRENIILCKTADGTEQPFRIKYIDRNFKTINIVAYHISYDLGDDVAINIAPTNLQVQAFGRWILNNATTHSNTYTFNSDIATIGSARYIRKNVLECIMGDDENSMLTKFGGEIKRDGYTITLNSRIGQDKGVRLLLGKNLNEIKITIDDTGLYTRVCPVGYDGLTLPEIYVDSPLINNYPFPKECVIKFEDIRYDETGQSEGSYDNLPDFYDALRDAVAKMYSEGLDKPLVNVDIDWIDLSKTEEYKNYASLETIALGDTLTCDMGDFYYQTRIIATTYDVLLDRITNFEIGKPIANYASKTNATIQQVESQDTSSLLEQAQANASALLKSAMTGYIYFDYEHGDLYIMDNADPQLAQKVWRWNLNGLGYSSTGINGTYGLAITMDGSIVADYITTGTLNTSVIQGYDSLVEQVESLVDLIKDTTGSGAIQLENAMEGELHRLEITGTISKVYPNGTSQYGYSLMISEDTIVSNDLYISSGVPYEADGTYPSSTLYPKDSYLKVDNDYYYLDFDYLNYLSDSVHDKYICEDGKQWIERYVGIDSNGDMYALDTPVIELKPDLIINVKENSIITLLSFSEATLTASYMIINEYTENFATKAYVGSKITQTKNEIDLEVQQKVSDDEIIAKLNLAVEDGQGIIDIKGNQVKITSDYFTLDETGHIEATSGEIAGFDMTATKFEKDFELHYNFTSTDRTKLMNYLQGTGTLTDAEKELYDLKGDGRLSVADYTLMTQLINGTYDPSGQQIIKGKLIIDSEDTKGLIKTYDGSKDRYPTKVGLYSIITGNVNTGTLVNNTIYGSTMYLTHDDNTNAIDITPNGVNYRVGSSLMITTDTSTGNISAKSFTNTSEEKKKKNIEKVKSGLDILKDIDIYTYNYKEENKKSNKKHYGVVIGDDYNYSQEITDNKNEGVDLYSFISVCCASIKEQQEQIEELQKEIKLLKEEKDGKDKLSK